MATIPVNYYLGISGQASTVGYTIYSDASLSTVVVGRTVGALTEIAISGNYPGIYAGNISANYGNWIVFDNSLGSFSAPVELGTTTTDPWATALPGSYGAGTAGYILGNTLNGSYPVAASQSSSGAGFSLTPAQAVQLELSILAGNHVATAVASNMQLVTYYLFSYSSIPQNVVMTALVNTTSGQVVQRTISNPFPTGTGS